MSAQRALAAAVVIVGVVAVGAAAAGVEHADGSTGLSEDPGTGPGDGAGQAGDGLDEGTEAGDGPGFPPWLTEAYLLLTVTVTTLIGLVGAVLYVWRERLAAIKALLRESLAVVVGMAICVLVVAVILWLSFDWSVWNPPEGTSEMDPGGGGAEDQSSVGTGVPPLVVAVGVLALVVVAGLLLRRRGGDDDDPEPPTLDLDPRDPDPAEPRPAPDAGGLDDEAPDNAVYRAWRDLATRVDPTYSGRKTPGEVAEAAIDQGLPREAVQTLTNVFSTVRYGGRPVTEERERRATSALRAIDAGSDD